MKLKKGSLEAKRFMAKIRAMKSKNKKKYIGATTYIEQKETKKTKPKKVLKAIRRPDGTFESFKNVRGKIGATKIIESKETKKTNAKKVLRRIRRPDGTFKSFVKVKGKISGLHKDTKSHNVKINVLSGNKNVLLNLAKERDDYMYRIENLVYETIYLRGDLKWLGKRKDYASIIRAKKSDIEFNKNLIKEYKIKLKKINSLIQKELKRK